MKEPQESSKTNSEEGWSQKSEEENDTVPLRLVSISEISQHARLTVEIVKEFMQQGLNEISEEEELLSEKLEKKRDRTKSEVFVKHSSLDSIFHKVDAVESLFGISIQYSCR